MDDRSYLKKENSKRQQVLYTMNPNKFQVCQFLMRHHEETRGDKVIIFSDNILALKEYAIILRRPYICGSTPHNERKRVLEQFRHSNKVSTIFLSKVGDNAIDLPEANVIIQISSQFGSRRQEAQRLGRILRPKLRSHVAGPESEDEYNAFYYSLVSTDTIEMYYSTKRQQFLVDQGYEFKVVKDVLKNQDTSQLCFQRQEDQSALLSKVLTESVREAGEQMNSQKREREDEQNGEGEKITKQQKRTEGSIGTLTGAEGITYLEYDARKQRQQQQNSSKKCALPLDAVLLPSFPRLTLREFDLSPAGHRNQFESKWRRS
jgi:DNA excision repair protein ERCC-3